MRPLANILPGCQVLPPLVDDGAPESAPPPTRATRQSAKKPKTRRRFLDINAFCDETLRTLDRAELAVWVLLWRDTQRSGLARASQADLARRAGVQERTVRRALKSLQKRGLLKEVRKGRLGVGASIYRIRPIPPA